MLRKLFALLLLLTGLAAIGAPAQAGVARMPESQVALAQVSREQARPDVLVGKSQRTTIFTMGDGSSWNDRAEPLSVFLPTVHLGADRARE